MMLAALEQRYADEARKGNIDIPEGAPVRITHAKKIDIMVFFELSWFDEDRFEVRRALGWAFADSTVVFADPDEITNVLR